MDIVLIAQFAVLVIGCVIGKYCRKARDARTAALICMGIVAAISLFSTFLWSNKNGGDNALIMLASATIGLVAVALSPLADSRSATFVRIQMLCGTALLFFITTHPLALLFLWTIQAFIVWRELKDHKATLPTARLFAVYHIPSCLLFLTGILLFRFDMNELATWFILLAILVREGIVPLQTWFTAMMEKAPMGIVVMFAEPQVGIYVLHELVPQAQFSAVISVILPLFALTAVLCAGLALSQTEARRALGYLMLSQSSLVAFGFEQSSHVAQAGSLLTWQVIGIATGSFAMVLAALGARKSDLRLITPSGHFAQTPKMATAFLILGFASVGLPGTLGFIAEDLLVQGSVADFPAIGFFLIIATAINGIVVMRLFFYLFCGQKTHAYEPDLVRRESWILSFVVGLLFIFGLAPQLILSVLA